MRMLVCTDPECPGVYRCSRKVLALGPGSCGCGAPLHAPCLWDRSEYDSDALSESIAVAVRSPASMRRKSGWSESPQCKSCKRIVANPGRECPSCGYLDGAGFVMGGRSADLPF